MKRTALVIAALLLAPPVHSAQAQITCTDISCADFTLLGPHDGSPSNFIVFGDSYPTYLYNPTTDFLFGSAVFQSIQGVHNRVSISGFTRAQINARFWDFPWEPGTRSMEAFYSEFFLEPTPTLVAFDWNDVAAIAFDTHGGPDPMIPTFIDYNYRVTQLAVAAVITPEPNSLALMFTGLLGIAAAAWSRRAAPR